MSTRKYESGFEKHKKKRKVEELIQSQKGTLERFVINTKLQILEKSNEDLNEKLVENCEEIFEDIIVQSHQKIVKNMIKI